MLTYIKIRRFKRFLDEEFELGKAVVLIGPNNSGKTAALQALALWDIGLKQWIAKRKGEASPEKRPGVAINRRDLTAIPVPNVNLLWCDLHVRNVVRVVKNGKPSPETKNVRIDIIVAGITEGKKWQCGLEFDFANEESFYCRPIRIGKSETGHVKRMQIPEEAMQVKTAFLPPMSGLSDREYLKQLGEISSLIGQGQTAQVLRNLCYQIHEEKTRSAWTELQNYISRLFGVDLLPPKYNPANAEIIMGYRERTGVELDLSSSGRGLQQTLLLLAHLYANPGTVLLLDEPDAHLEILRQQQIYQLVTEVAEKNNSQLVIASHSEVVLNEAADRDIVIAFIGKPHRIDDQGSQAMKALKEIGFEQYYQAEQTGWVLYLEGSTDLAILKAFANALDHEAKSFLERPFVHYVLNQPTKARDHFFGLLEAKKDLVGIAIFDRLDKELGKHDRLKEIMWERRELENYLCSEEVLLAYAQYDLPDDDLFGQAEATKREGAMSQAIAEIASALKTLRKLDIWSPELKATDEVLDRLFEKYFEKLGMPNLLRKSDYHVLAQFVPKSKIDLEIVQKLDAIVETATRAVPRTD